MLIRGLTLTSGSDHDTLAITGRLFDGLYEHTRRQLMTGRPTRLGSLFLPSLPAQAGQWLQPSVATYCCGDIRYSLTAPGLLSTRSNTQRRWT